MADWHVSESENEEDGEPNGGRDPGLPVKATTLLNLIQTLEKERVLRLECASVLSGDRSHRKRRKKKRKRSNNEGGIGGDTTSEIASETDIKSAHTTTPSDCRDTRRYVSVFLDVLVRFCFLIFNVILVLLIIIVFTTCF